jgi:hypothetical protein
MSITALNGVIMKSFKDLGLACPVGYEGVAFTPPDAGLWAYATIMPVSSDQRLQTADKYIRILQVDCNGDMNVGTGDLAGLIDQILSYYKPRRLFTNTAGTQKLRVKKSDDGVIRIYGGYQSAAVSITFDGSVDREFS